MVTSALLVSAMTVKENARTLARSSTGLKLAA